MRAASLFSEIENHGGSPANMNTHKNYSPESHPDFPWAWVTGLGRALAPRFSYSIIINALHPPTFCTFIGRSYDYF